MQFNLVYFIEEGRIILLLSERTIHIQKARLDLLDF